jgi:NAD(P)-dependent dehydrogenase (short-subunit alcohol dehydrogenase family)
VTVAPGSTCTQSADAWSINPENKDDYRQLVAGLQAENALPATVVHLWNLAETPDQARSRTRTQLSFVYLAQALQACKAADPLHIIGVTAGREAVLASDQIDCRQALIAGPAKVIPFEYPHIRFTTIDIDPASDLPGLLQQEPALRNSGGGSAIALRGGLRFVKDYTVLDTAEPAPASILREQGVYLVTGGLGGVGMAHAQALAASHARLALLQRSPFPAQETWPAILADDGADPVLKEQVKGLRALQEAGAEVKLLQADVTDSAQVADAIAGIKQSWGAIHGLVHCAGYGEFVPIKETSKDIIDAVLAPKVEGTDILLGALAGEPLELVLLCSSMSVETTGYGLVGYVSACAYLDAVAQAHRRTRPATRFVSINWDVWSTPQQTARAQSDSVLAQRLEGSKNAISPREGMAVIHRALACGKPQAIISTTDFRQLLRKNQKMSAALQADGDEAPAESGQENLALYDRPSLSTEYVAPRTDAEKLLASIWQETLGIARIGVNDNFFELGGESLLGVKIVVKAKKAGLQIDPKQMFATPTIAEIAANLGSNVASAARPARVSADRYALTPLQSDILARHADTSRPPANVIQALSVMEGPLDKALLQAVWQALVARHPVLRTRFVAADGAASLQVIEPQAGFSLIEVDYSQLEETARQAALDALMTKDRQTRYDLTQAPAMRVYWVNLDPECKRFAVLLSQHQIILDGWTSSLLSQDLFACLMALATGADLPPPVSSVEFGAYVEWLGKQADEECRNWWRDRFAGAASRDPLQAIMAPQPLPNAGEDAYGSHEITIDAELLSAIQHAAKATRTTGNSLFQAAWAMTLAQLGGSEEVVYGITISGRGAGFEGVEEVVGQCTNSLPVRVAVHGGTKASQLAQAVHAANADAQAHNGLAASEIAALAGCEPGRPLYTSNFIYENVPRAVSGEGELPIKTLATSWVDGWHFPLRVFVVPEETTWVRIAFDRSLFPAAEIAALAANYHRNLAAIAEQPEATVAQCRQEIAYDV